MDPNPMRKISTKNLKIKNFTQNPNLNCWKGEIIKNVLSSKFGFSSFSFEIQQNEEKLFKNSLVQKTFKKNVYDLDPHLYLHQNEMDP